ncbi:alpha/beta fold hydrolase [Gracilibacillus xinjiangensis]|uniref:Alpha/beta fold hydrolase n=1 Tax=Gracilibacillus xinjiangensis TaxID=1193282 RepID=A0ABV8WY13_9BACI
MNIPYREHGDKTASLLLFIHGGGVSGWMWDQQVEHFRNFHCIVPNLPEHGLDNYDVTFSIKASAESLITLIEEKAKGKEVIVVGFSLGAQILVQMLSQKPELIDIAIINSALVMPSPSIIKVIEPAIKLSFPLIKWKSFSKLQARMLYIKDASFQQYYKESSQIKRESLVRVLKENMSFSIPENFPQATAKILVTVGQKEKKVMKKSAKALVKSNSNSTGIILHHIGHGISLANPEWFNQLIENWLKQDLSELKGSFTVINSIDN